MRHWIGSPGFVMLLVGAACAMGAGCGSSDAFLSDTGPRLTDARFVDASDATLGARDAITDVGTPSTCGVYASGVSGWGKIDCEMPACEIDVALDPVGQSEALRWIPCTGPTACSYLGTTEATVWNRVAARNTDHGPMLWLERSTQGAGNDTRVWELRPEVGPAVAMFQLDRTLAPFIDGGLTYQCDVRAFGVGQEASGIEFGDSTTRHAVIVRGPNAVSPEWQSTYAGVSYPVSPGGALAATRGSVYIGVQTVGLFRVAGDAGQQELIDMGWEMGWESPVHASVQSALSATATSVFYLGAERSNGPGRPAIRAIDDGAQPVTLETSQDADGGTLNLYGFATSASTLAWMTDMPDSARLWQSPLSTRPGGLLKRPVVDLPERVSPSVDAAVGFGYYAYCTDRCQVVRLSDGARFAVPYAVASYQATALWVGPDEIAFSLAQGFGQVVWRVPFTALDPL